MVPWQTWPVMPLEDYLLRLVQIEIFLFGMWMEGTARIHFEDAKEV